MGLLKTIFILGIIYYSFKLIGKYLFPYFIKRTVNRMTQQQQGGSDFMYEQKKQEGKVTIQKPSGKNKKSPNNSGEYVDYEEI